MLTYVVYHYSHIPLQANAIEEAVVEASRYHATLRHRVAHIWTEDRQEAGWGSGGFD